MGKNSEAESEYLGFLRMGALGFIKDLEPDNGSGTGAARDSQQ